MNLKVAIALLAAAALAACSTSSTSDLGGLDQGAGAGGAGTEQGSETETENNAVGDTSTTGVANLDPTPGSVIDTPSPGVANTDAKAFFKSTVHPALATACGACHDAQGPGPAWIFKTDIDKTYITFENLGYIAKPSRIETKGAHPASGGPALVPDAATKLNTWIDMELKARGNKAPVNIKEKLGTCFDKAKFDAIGLAQLNTDKRNNENANTCTGCDNAPCMTCHTSDPATGVIISYGNNNVPGDNTFQVAKTLPFMDIVIATNGTDIVGSTKLKVKADATKKDKPYTHPMYVIPNQMQNAINAFAADIAAKYKAGGCQ